MRLLDHDFPIAPSHKLVPSVYAVCNHDESGKLTKSGPTHVRIRSGKHDLINASVHAKDVEELFNTGALEKKPIMIFETDGKNLFNWHLRFDEFFAISDFTNFHTRGGMFFISLN